MHARSCEFGKALSSETLPNVRAQLLVPLQSCWLELLEPSALEPIRDGVRNGGAAARRGVSAGADRRPHLCVIGVGVALPLEGSNMSGAGLIGIGDNPGLADFSAAGFPHAATDGHFRPSCGGVRSRVG